MWLAISFPVHQDLSEKASILKRKNFPPRGVKRGLLKMKEFAAMGRKFFPTSVDPFYRREQNNFSRVVSLKSVSLPLYVFIVASMDQL